MHELKTELIGYAPELRAVLLYYMQLEDGSGVCSRKEFIGKTSSYKIPEILFADQWALWNSCSHRVNIPMPVGYLSNPRLTLQERVPGVRLATLVKSPAFRNLLKQTADSIAAIHHATAPLNKFRDPIRETQSLRKWSVILQSIRTDLSRRLQVLQMSLLREMESRTVVQGPVHGDFHPTNVLVDDEKVYLIDFDQLAFGDPSADIGRFLASFRITSLRSFGVPASLDEAAGIFLEEYLNAGNGNVSSIRMFEAASLITTAASAFRVQRAGWEDEVLILVEEAERVFESSRPRDTAAVEHTGPVTRIEESWKWSADLLYMQAVLGMYLRRREDVQIFSCDVLSMERTRYGLRNSYRLTGEKRDAFWSCEVDGFQPHRGRRRSMFNQLVFLYEECERREEAFRIPEPVAYVSSIGMIMQIPLMGTTVLSLLGSPEAPELATRLAHSLSILHKTKVECSRIKSPEHILQTLDETIGNLKNPDFKILKLLEIIKKRIPVNDSENCLTIHSLTPDRVVSIGGRPGISKIDDLFLSHPSLDFAEFLVHLELFGIEQKRHKEAAIFANNFRSAYRLLEADSSTRLTEFEALTAVSLACSHVRRNDSDSIGKLLDSIAARILAG